MLKKGQTLRIGAVHSIIFGGFSAESIAGRIKDCKSEYVVTADEGVRGIEDVIETTKNACAAGALLAGTSTFPSLTKIKEISELVEINPR